MKIERMRTTLAVALVDRAGLSGSGLRMGADLRGGGAAYLSVSVTVREWWS